MFPLKKPLLNAAGTLGFTPNPRGPVDLVRLGAFVTNPVSYKPRQTAESRGLQPFPGGFLLHTGYPNPGLRRVIEQNEARWAAASLPVIVHLMAEHPEELSRMVQRLEGVEGVMGIELGIRPEATPEEVRSLAQAGMGELPLIVQLPPERVDALGDALHGLEIAAISLAAPRGLLPRAQGGLAHGRLFGPGLLPGALAAVETALRFGFPVIGGGGVYCDADIQAMLEAGATAVQLDAVLWKV
jgi:dihydroorotate dehydrogenase (NAD+) catalytic subunit